MTEKRSKKLSPRFKTALSIVLFILLLIFATLIYFSRKLEPVVAKLLKESVLTATDGLYTISFTDIHLNPFTGSVQFDNINFRANDSVYQKMRKKGIHPTHLYSVAVKSLALRHVHPFKVYFNRDLDVGNIQINYPTVRVYYQHPRADKAVPEDKRTAWQRLSKYLKSIKVEQINFDNIDFQYIDKSLGKSVIDGVKNLTITIDDLLIDSLSQYDKSRFYFTKEIFVRVRKHEYLSRDKMYTILFNELKVSSSHKYAWVKGLQVIPRYPEMEFYKHLPSRKAHYELHLNEALLTNIDIKRLIDKRQLRASKLSFMNADFQAFLDKRKEAPKYDRGINFPQLALKRFRLNTVIDTIQIYNTSLLYREYTPFTARAGKFHLNNINGSFLNFTNDSIALLKNKWVRANLTSMLYGKAKMQLNFNFNLRSPSLEYNYTGSLNEMNARHFNQLSRPLALLRINSGKISTAQFSVKADYRKATGHLLMKYKDLNIGLLKIDSSKVIRKQMLRSLVANNLLIMEDNPSKGGAIRVGKINFQRPDSIAFFGTLWHSIYSGLKETIGLTNEREYNLKMQFQGLSHNDPDREKQRMLRREKRRNKKSQ